MLKGTRSVVVGGGFVSDKLPDRNVIFSSVVKRCVESLLGLRVFRLGQTFVKQMRGIPKVDLARLTCLRLRLASKKASLAIENALFTSAPVEIVSNVQVNQAGVNCTTPVYVLSM